MNYIKRYTKGDSDNYNIVKEFTENHILYSYAVGITEGNLLITKIDFYGDIVWEKFYSNRENLISRTGFTDIIQVGNSEKVIYVLPCVFEDFENGLIAINPEGDIVWQKKLNEHCPKILLTEVPQSDIFFVTTNNPDENLIKVSAFDSTGSLQACKEIEREVSITINAGLYLNDHIHFCGGLKIKDKIYPGYFTLDAGLSQFKAEIISNVKGIAESLEVNNQGQVILCGYNDDSGTVFFTEYPRPGSLQRMFLIENSRDKRSKILWQQDSYFYLHIYNHHGHLIKIDSKNQLQWKKTLIFDIEEKNNFKSITQKLNHFSFISKWRKEGDLAGKSLLDFETCKTQAEDIPRTESIETNIHKSGYEVREKSLSLEDMRFDAGELRPSVHVICKPKNPEFPTWNDFTSLQNSSFVLSAAGSDGFDGSAKGIHLRWDFSGILGDLHLPKGDYTQNTQFFNKPDDFVRLYRAPYQPVITTFDFNTAPQAVDHVKRLWIYQVQGKLVYLWFRNHQQYDSIAGTTDPLQNPFSFLSSYQDHLLEFEAKRDFFYAFRFSTAGMINDSYIQLEALSSKDQTLLAPKFVQTRKKMSPDDEDKPFYITNGKSIRLKASQCIVAKLNIEFYSDFIVYANEHSLWDYLGEYSLTLDDNIAKQQLEPTQNLIHGEWLHYTDDECVNTENYHHRWNGLTEGQDRNIKQIVSTFLEYSTNGTNNPTGIDYLTFINEEDNEENYLQPNEDEEADEGLPLLEFLRAGSVDYHVARMLGLGILDISEQVLNEEPFIYVAQYETLKSLDNPAVEHYQINLSMSLPTSMHNQRLPIPYELEQIIPGIVSLNEPDTIYPYTDEEGYTFDGLYRYVSLKAAPIFEEGENPLFYSSLQEYDSSSFSYSAFAGLEYKQNQEEYWRKPELGSNTQYRTLYNQLPGSFEPIPIYVDDDHSIVYIHKQGESGDHHYALYGVNLFSRTSIGSDIRSINTELLPKNTLLPPHQVSAHLIVKEQPLIFTTSEEQNRFDLNQNEDKTLVRLIFEFNAVQDLKSYQVEEEFTGVSDQDLTSEVLLGTPNHYYPDEKEIYADLIDIYFRPETPQAVRGRITQIQSNLSNPLEYIFQTGPFVIPSSSSSTDSLEILTPYVSPSHQGNFVGSVLSMGSQQFLIQAIDTMGSYPSFIVVQHPDNPNLNEDDYIEEPMIENDGLFIVVENLQEPSAWNHPIHEAGGNNPHSFQVQIGHSDNNLWKVHREIIHVTDDEGNETRFLEKTRGFWRDALIEPHEEVVDIIHHPDGTTEEVYGFRGVYKATFVNFQLPSHEQFNTNGISVEWYRGSIRLKTQSNFASSGNRKSLDVFTIGQDSFGNLVLYFEDPQYPLTIEEQEEYDAVQEGLQEVNFYPGYKVYLYTQPSLKLTEEATLPESVEEVKYTLFGLRSRYTELEYLSKFSIPAMMYGQKHQEPGQPLKPEGVLYATRPDTEGKSTYTLEVSFGTGPQSSYKPYGLLFLRSNEDAFLNALYDRETVYEIRQSLDVIGGLDEQFVRLRWENFLDFETLQTEGTYLTLPPDHEDAYTFPMPNHPKFIEAINEFVQWHNQHNGNSPDASILTEITSLNQEVIGIIHGVQHPLLVVDFIEQTIESTFFPLTEVPVIYEYIRHNYEPRPGKQVIRNSQGHMLDPNDEAFDIAPMAKRKNSQTNTVLFTDFTLDGTSKNLYFYGVKEMNIQMQLGKMSTSIGPIKLVNSNPPDAPEIVEVFPVLENRVLSINPHVQLNINSYDKIHHIKKIQLYRTFDPSKSSSVLSMEKVLTFDVEIMGWEDYPIWSLTDDFSDLIEVPFGTPIYYRVVAKRIIEYSDLNDNTIIDYAPSYSSKLLAVILPESYAPVSPSLNLYSEPIQDGQLRQVHLQWNKTCYQGTYHLYKMTKNGQWNKIFEISGNQESFIVPLMETQWEDHSLVVESEDQKPVYHHFKVIAENTAGMMSKEEHILTVYNEADWQDIGGIGEMIIGGTFYIR
ncbi:MAG: hypothetical protein RBR78_00030 [Flavobacteriaceae bacterium]|jgi:hypothetical protein|nr:hypothetical protein [Flavobacteriaceae bacterium]